MSRNIHFLENFDKILSVVGRKIAEGNVVGWFQDRMGIWPACPWKQKYPGGSRESEMQKMINLKIKFREGFRPFAPAVLMEDVDKYFIHGIPSPYMLFVFLLKDEYRKLLPENIGI